MFLTKLPKTRPHNCLAGYFIDVFLQSRNVDMPDSAKILSARKGTKYFQTRKRNIRKNFFNEGKK